MIVNYFKGKGWSRNALSAMLGNMRKESSINPDMSEYNYAWSADRGYGLVQWTPRSKYWNWAEARGLSPSLGSSQLARIDYEVEQNIQWIATSSYPLSFASFRASTESVSYLTQAFTWNYERPNTAAGQASMAERIAFANRCYNELNWDDDGGGGPTEPPPIEPPPAASQTWQRSDAAPVEIFWTPFEAIVPVNPDKELLHATIEVINEEAYPGHFDNLRVEKNLLNDKLLAANVVYIPIDSTKAGIQLNRTVFGALDAVKIVSIHYVPEQAIQGADTSTLRLSIVNEPEGQTLATKTFIAGANAEAKKVFDFGPVLPAAAIIPKGTSLSLVKDPANTLPQGVLIIQWDVV